MMSRTPGRTPADDDPAAGEEPTMGLPTHGWMPGVGDASDAVRTEHFVAPGRQIAPDVGSISYLAQCGALCRPVSGSDPDEPETTRCPICACAAR